MRTAQSIGPVERLLHLRRSPVLRELGASELAVLAEHARERTFRRGELLLRDGEPATSLHVVVDGRVHVARKGRLLGHAGAGAVAGGFAVFARDGDGVEARAEAETLTLELDADVLLEIFEDHFAILHHVLKQACGRLADIFGAHPTTMRGAAHPVAERGAPTGLDLVQRIFYLRRVVPFSRCSINALAELSRGLTEMVFEPGTRLWDVGDVASSVLMLVDGKVDCRTAAGGEFAAWSGAPLGALDGVAGRPRFFSAVTVTRVVALEGQVEALVDVLEDNFEMAMDYLEVMARWLLETHERSPDVLPGGLDDVYGCDESAHPG